MLIQDILLPPPSYESITNEGDSGSADSIVERIRSYECADRRYSEDEIDLLWELGFDVKSYVDNRSGCVRCCFPVRLGNQQACSEAKEYVLSLFRESIPSLVSNRELQQRFPYFGITLGQPGENEEKELIKLMRHIRALLPSHTEAVFSQYLSPLVIISSADRFLELLQHSYVLSTEKCLNIETFRELSLNERVAAIGEQLSTTQQQEISVHRVALLPDEVCRLPNLHTIRLGFCMGLKVLPNLAAIERLQTLHITCSSVEDLSPISDVTTLIDLEIGRLRNIKRMFTFHNLSRLEKFSASHMPLQELPEGVKNLTSLRELLLDRTQIQSLPSEIGRCQALQKIALPQTVQRLPQEIESLPNLQELKVYSSCAIPSSLAEKVTLIQDSQRSARTKPIFTWLAKWTSKEGVPLSSSEEETSDS